MVLSTLVASLTLIECGTASWYGSRFQGNRTASGEIFNQYELTAAHKTLPFGTEVIVITEGGERLTVEINDRGPYIRDRVIDLSSAGAKELGFKNRGTASVCLYVEN